ncbi:hypothetical protein JW777_10930, partial [bacterium]|nr:hypothetical protein [bacterium]
LGQHRSFLISPQGLLPLRGKGSGEVDSGEEAGASAPGKRTIKILLGQPHLSETLARPGRIPRHEATRIRIKENGNEGEMDSADARSALRGDSGACG